MTFCMQAVYMMYVDDTFMYMYGSIWAAAMILKDEVGAFRSNDLASTEKMSLASDLPANSNGLESTSAYHRTSLVDIKHLDSSRIPPFTFQTVILSSLRHLISRPSYLS